MKKLLLVFALISLLAVGCNDSGGANSSDLKVKVFSNINGVEITNQGRK